VAGHSQPRAQRARCAVSHPVRLALPGRVAVAWGSFVKIWFVGLVCRVGLSGWLAGLPCRVALPAVTGP
jgi:hypothetical protein